MHIYNFVVSPALTDEPRIDLDEVVAHIQEPRRGHTTIRRAVTALAVLMCLSVGWSLGKALLKDDGLTIAGKLAGWARNHHLGSLVDAAESVRYRNPPSDSGADTLPNATVAATVAPHTTETSPPPLDVVNRPALPREGRWRVARTVDGQPTVWTTGIRPSRQHRGITATHVLIDQDRVRAVLHNGTDIPGGRDWMYGNAMGANETADAVFAFNGGFRREHSGGGYFTEGREVWPLKDGVATLAIDSDGQIHVGRWGAELDPLGVDGRPWASVRQNLELLVIDGKLSPRLNTGYWGGGRKGEIFILRSAVCERVDGKIMFTIMGLTDATSLAGAMRDAGCQYAMQLDQNESYPRGYVFEEGVPHEIDTRMLGRTDDFIRGYSRDFFVYVSVGAKRFGRTR